MNFANVRDAVKRVISKHSGGFRLIASSQTQLLELASVTGIAEHYRSLGASVNAVNPKGKRGFVVKTSTRGYPWNFSYFACELAGEKFEIRMNLMVNGAHDDGIYCVDVGITKNSSVPYSKPAVAWIRVENSDLITFAETKKLVVYPMLLAQFVGIVHEIKPEFLKAGATQHLPPTLITIGHLTGNSQAIVSAYPSRNFRISIAYSYDIRLARVRSGAASPFV
ncbi:hypothetical protein [Pseudoxanthomonas sp. 10H]|uniref:hypothetical protein n=1 Tax=Pseudoxanthomonas sp. 10H TaxID=3242729 RepID=UPI003555FADE